MLFANMTARQAHSPTSVSQRSERKLLLCGCAFVIAAFAVVRSSNSVAISHLFDYLHWTVAYFMATILAWRGVRAADPEDKVPRRWFARALTITLAAQLLFDIRELTGWTPIPNLSDFLFLSFGPCCVIGLAAIFRRHPRSTLQPFLLDVTSWGVVMLTLTLALYLPRGAHAALLDLAILTIYPVSMLLPAFVAVIMAPTLRASWGTKCMQYPTAARR